MPEKILNFLSYTGDPVADIFHYISLVSLCTVVFSCFKMLWYLNDRGIERYRLFSSNPLLVFDYLRITKSEDGNVGIWAKVLMVSIVLIIFSEIILLIL